MNATGLNATLLDDNRQAGGVERGWSADGKGGGGGGGGSAGGGSHWMWLSMALPFLSSLLGLGGGSRRGAGGRAGGMQAGGGLGLLGGLSPVSLAASFCLQTVGSWVALIADRLFLTAFVDQSTPPYLWLSTYLEDLPPAFRLTKAYQVEVVENPLAVKKSEDQQRPGVFPPPPSFGSPPGRKDKGRRGERRLESLQNDTLNASRQHSTRSTVFPSALKIVSFSPDAYLLVSLTTMPNHHLLAGSRHLIPGSGVGAGGQAGGGPPWMMQMMQAAQGSQQQSTTSDPQSRYLQIRVVPKLRLPFFGRSSVSPRRTLKDLVHVAKEAYAKASPNALRVHTLSKVCESAECPMLRCIQWNGKPTRSKRSVESVLLPNRQNLKLRNDLQEFIGSRSWYRERGIPFHRGVLLYGPPGTGKSSLAAAVAGDLGLDIYTIDLNEPWMTDRFLAHAISQTSPNCIVLVEDIDVAFAPTRARTDPTPPPHSSAPLHPSAYSGRRPRGPPGAGRGPTPHGREDLDAGTRSGVNGLTMSGLLNVLDGVGSAEGKIFICTTNHIAHLDAALTRPGRLDVHVRFDLADTSQIESLFGLMMLPSAREAEEQVERGKSRDEVERERGEVEKAKMAFGKIVPSGLFSTAALQGFLLQHKTPGQALSKAVEWVDGQRAVVLAEREEREAKWAERVRDAEERQKELDERASDAKRRVFQMSDDDDWTEHLKEEALTASSSKILEPTADRPVDTPEVAFAPASSGLHFDPPPDDRGQRRGRGRGGRGGRGRPPNLDPPDRN